MVLEGFEIYSKTSSLALFTFNGLSLRVRILIVRPGFLPRKCVGHCNIVKPIRLMML